MDLKGYHRRGDDVGFEDSEEEGGGEDAVRSGVEVGEGEVF